MIEDRFVIDTPGTELIFVEKDSIYFFEAQNDIVKVRAHGREPYFHEENIDRLEERLSRPPFFRTGEDIIINLNRIYKLKRNSLWDYEIRMLPPVNRLFSVEKEKIGQLKETLGIET